MHEHAGCKHSELKHCAVCDVAYCPACKREWKTPPILNIPLWATPAADGARGSFAEQYRYTNAIGTASANVTCSHS